LGSKFYGYLFPVKNAQDFEQKIKAFKEEYSDATHVCSAVVLGVDADYQRFSDDGEPSNSAGRPILYELLSSKMTFVGCAVVRYYGGKKLGVPGLIEAYGTAAKECTEQAEPVVCYITSSVVCTIDPSVEYKLYNFLSKNKDYTYSIDDGKFVIECLQSMTEELRKKLSEIDTLAFY
jgi:uncharacterized YigZ family protein